MTSPRPNGTGLVQPTWNRFGTAKLEQDWYNHDQFYAGRRTDFRDKNRELFSGELFSGELFSGLPENFVPINVCGVDSFSPN